MEYLDGVDLSVVLKSKKMEWQDVVQIIEPVLQSLHIIHENKIINYNISPENIMMTRDRTVKLRGFEASKFYDEERKKSKKNILSGFSAYEMYQSDLVVTPSADVYSIAAVIYYAITGIIIPSAVDRYDKDTVVPPSKLGITIPKNVENAIMNALNVEQKYRTKSCKAFLAQLHSQEPVSRVVEPNRKSDSGKFGKKTKILLASSIGVAACLIVTIVLLLTTVFNPFASEAKEFPNLIGLTQEQVKEELKKVGMNEDAYQIIGFQSVEGAESGTMIWQDVEPGSKITNPDAIVSLKIAKEPIDFDGKMIDLIGMNKLEATAELEKWGFTNYHFKVKEAEGFAKGVVCDTNFYIGKNINLYDYLLVYISKSNNKPEEETVEETEEKTSTTSSTKATSSTKPTQATQGTTKATQATTKATQATTKPTKPTQKPTQKPTEFDPDSVIGDSISVAKVTLGNNKFNVVEEIPTDTDNEMLDNQVYAVEKKGNNNVILRYYVCNDGR